MALSRKGYSDAWWNYVEKSGARLLAKEIKEQTITFEEIGKYMREIRKEIYHYPNVAGIGASLKMTKGDVQNIPCVTVFVRQKLSQDLLKGDSIPRSIVGFPTDVIEAGMPHLLQQYATRQRPVTPGYSIGHSEVTAGTLGGIVRDRRTSELLFLSNNHVLANTNSGTPGDKILQPGTADGGTIQSDTVAELVRFRRIEDPPGENRIDAAVARPLENISFVPGIPGLGLPRGMAMIHRAGTVVQKVGRTTGHTMGVVTSIHAGIPGIKFGMKEVEFVDCITTQGMSGGGDSGSMVLDREKNAVGLLFAGMSGSGEEEIVTYVCDIHNIVRDSNLNVDLVTA